MNLSPGLREQSKSALYQPEVMLSYRFVTAPR